MKASTLLNGLPIVALAFLWATTAPADERDDKIRALEQRLEQLEKLLRQRGLMPATSERSPATRPASPPSAPEARPVPDATAKAETRPAAPTLSVGPSGFSLRSADTNFALRIRGLLQVDSRWYVDDGGISDNDGFLLRRARPILEGTVFRDFDFQFTPEFGGSSPSIRDAWLNYRYAEPLQLRIGKMKSPGGLERWQSVANIAFIERSLVSDLWPSRDLGLMLHGELWPGDESVKKTLASSGLAHYAVGVFNGAGDGVSASNSDPDENIGMTGRLFFHPFLKTESKALHGLGIGVSGTYGDAEGSRALPDGGGYDTEGQQTFFTYLSGAGTTPATANVIADGNHWRLGPQAYWYWGPFGLLGEYAISSQRLQRQAGATSFTRADNRAWAATASWLLTGEDATFRGVTPGRSFDPREGHWGAWQVVARYSGLDIDDDVFPNFADPTESATRATAWGVGLNWYLNRNVRASFDFNHTDFKGGESGSVTGQDENVFLTRVQLAF